VDTDAPATAVDAGRAVEAGALVGAPDGGWARASDERDASDATSATAKIKRRILQSGDMLSSLAGCTKGIDAGRQRIVATNTRAALTALA
jgi:hypothetical protein